MTRGREPDGRDGGGGGHAGGAANRDARRAWHHTVLHAFDRFAGHATRGSGSPTAFVLAVAVVAVWLITGPFFGYSDTWQLVINTGTTVVTFLMVFLIQQSQNKDSVAVHLKLNELLASHMEASNHLVDIEELDEDELRHLMAFYRHLARLAQREGGVKISHSLDEAALIHAAKQEGRRRADAAAVRDEDDEVTDAS